MTEYNLRDFNAQTGPPSLFKRVRFKFKEPRRLNQLTQFRGGHYPPYLEDVLKRFDSKDWELVSAQVRDDSGRFVATAWRRFFGDTCWWVVIGQGDVISGLYQVDPSQTGLSPQTVQRGELFELVEEVNAGLMAEEGGAQPAPPLFLDRKQANHAFKGDAPDFFFYCREKGHGRKK